MSRRGTFGAETHPSDGSVCRLDEDRRLRVIVALERAPLCLAVSDFNGGGKSHVSRRRLHAFRGYVQETSN